MGEKKEPILRKFSSPEEMAQSANHYFQIGKIKEDQAEIKRGFDISDINSVMAFDIPFTPLGATVIVKEIKKSDDPEEDAGGIIPVDLSIQAQKWIVMVPGLLVTTLQRGDIVCFRASFKENPVIVTDRRIGGVIFKEVAYYDIGGVCVRKEEMDQRIAEIERRQRLSTVLTPT